MCDQMLYLHSSNTTPEVVDFKLGGGEGERTATPLTGLAHLLQCPPAVKKCSTIEQLALEQHTKMSAHFKHDLTSVPDIVTVVFRPDLLWVLQMNFFFNIISKGWIAYYTY